jgi:hypothetical protein
MEEPLFTYEISDSFLKATEIADTFLQHECLRQAIEQLPPGHKAIAEALIGLFHKIIQNHGKNKMDANNLATIFAPSLISRSRDNSIQQILMDMVPASRVLNILITFYEQIFLNKPLPGEEDQGPQSKKQEQIKAFQNSLRTGTLRYASNLIKKERERINSEGGHRRQSSMIDGKEREITDPILVDKLQKKKAERKHAKEIFGPISESPLSSSPSENTTDSPRSDSSKEKDSGRLRSSSSAVTNSSDKNRIIPVLKKQVSSGSSNNDSPPDSAKASPRKSSVVPKLDMTKERKPHRSQTEQGLKKPKTGAERRMSSLPGKTHSRKQSLRQLDKIQSQMNQLREQKQQLLTRATSASTPSSPRGPVNPNTNNKEEAKSTPASPTSDMMSPRRSSIIMNTNQDVASFLSALITQNGSIDDVDEYLASPRSDVSSNSGMDDDYDWANDDDSEDEISSASSSTVGTDSPNSPRIFYNDNVDVPKLVDECYQLVVDGKLSEVPTILEKENVSPEKLTVIYDLLDTKLEKLAAETEAK